MIGRGPAVERGFTLLEVLVAFVILVMSLSVLFRIFSGGLQNLERSEQYNFALVLAESRIADAVSGQQLIEGESSGETENGMRWVRRVEPYTPWEEEKVLSVPVRAYQVSVDVSWGSVVKPRQLSLSTVRLSGG
ncbi:MAG: prepilin-type N-terminal cleavage/methylation domain-containing protein [Candidatus Sedimenticola sp. 20ELBAFRAG]